MKKFIFAFLLLILPNCSQYIPNIIHNSQYVILPNPDAVKEISYLMYINGCTEATQEIMFRFIKHKEYGIIKQQFPFQQIYDYCSLKAKEVFVVEKDHKI